MQDRVFDTADVLVDRHPLGERVEVPGLLGIGWVTVTEKIPGRVDKSVHRVGLAAGVSTAGRAGHVDPVVRGGKRGTPLGRVVLDIGQADR